MGCVKKNIDLVIFALLVVVGFFFLRYHFLDSGEAAAILVGALWGAAALLLGNWINRWNERRKTDIELAERRSKLRALIAAEFVNVAAGLISAETILSAAVTSSQAGGTLPGNMDLTVYAPRPMAFTDNMGSELLILNRRDIDALATVRSNLAISKMSIDEVTSGKRSFGVLTAAQLRQGIRHDMKMLAEAFERFAPELKLKLSGNDPELASTILRRLAGEKDLQQTSG